MEALAVVVKAVTMEQRLGMALLTRGVAAVVVALVVSKMVVTVALG
jgi:hypothetical protein